MTNFAPGSHSARQGRVACHSYWHSKPVTAEAGGTRRIPRQNGHRRPGGGRKGRCRGGSPVRAGIEDRQCRLGGNAFDRGAGEVREFEFHEYFPDGARVASPGQVAQEFGVQDGKAPLALREGGQILGEMSPRCSGICAGDAARPGGRRCRGKVRRVRGRTGQRARGDRPAKAAGAGRR